MITQKLETISQILGCYFHQNWNEEFDDDTAALQAIISSETKERLLDAFTEVDTLLGMGLSESELREIISGEAGCYFEPDSRKITYKDWLRQVRDAFLSALFLSLVANFVSGRDRSIEAANQLEIFLDEAFPDDDYLQETVEMLACYRADGDGVIGVDHMRKRLSRVNRYLQGL